MKVFIAPIYFQTNSISSEKLTGGLLLYSTKKSWLAFSEEKMTVAGKLGGLDLKKLLEHTLNLFQNKIEKDNQSTKKGTDELFEFGQGLTDQYLVYLSKYSKGVIQFAPPKPIAIEPSDTAFAKLFEMYVGEKLVHKNKKEKHVSFHHAIKEKLTVPGLDEKADIEYEIQPNQIKGILKPAQLTLITKNGSIEAVQAIDFSNSIKTVVDHIYEFEVIASHLHKFEIQKNLKKGNYKIVVNKPMQGSDQEKLFNDFYQSAKDTFGIIEPSDIAEIVNDILKKPHTKFSEFLLTV